MTILKNNNKWNVVRRLIIASTTLTLATGLSSISYAQGDGHSALGMQQAEMAANQHHSDASIQGTWLFNIEVPGPGIKFHSLISFASDGVVITSASPLGSATSGVPEVYSPFYGSWRQIGRNRFQAVFYAFVADASGAGAGTRKVSLTVQLTGRNELVGTAFGSDCDLQGQNCVQNVQFQNTGRRILP